MSRAARDLAWLELVPAGLLPDGYVDRLLEVEEAHDRAAAPRARLADAEAALDRSLHDPEATAAQLDELAHTVLARQTIVDRWPAVEPVPPEVDEEIAAGLVAAMQPLAVSPGRPPQVCAETWHYMVDHSNTLDPLPTILDVDHLAMQTFDEICAEGAALAATMRALSGPLAGTPLPERVAAVHEFSAGPLAAYARAVAKARPLLDQIDEQRGPRAHRCRLAGGSGVQLDPVPFGAPWSLDWAVHGNGRPPQPAHPFPFHVAV